MAFGGGNSRNGGGNFNALYPAAMTPQAQVRARVRAAQQEIEKICRGEARALAGNTRHIGRSGAIPPTKVQRNTAAVIPEQFDPSFHSGDHLRPYAPRIHGVVGNAPFTSVTEVINNTRSPVPGKSTRDAFQQLNPGQLILEIPGAKDQGSRVPVTVYVPPELNCPVGTQLVGTQTVDRRLK